MHGSLVRSWFLGITIAGLLGMVWPPGNARGDDPVITLREALVLPAAGRSARSALHTDVVEARIVAGTWQAPAAGDAATLADGSTQNWERIEAKEDGTFQHRALAGGYASVAHEAARDGVMILEASGHALVYADGEPRAGDPYSQGYVHLPVRVRAGTNHFLFVGGRGTLQARLVPPRGDWQLNTADVTLPDLILGVNTRSWGAVPVLNGTGASDLTGVLLRVRLEGSDPVESPLPSIPAIGARKVPFLIVGSAPDAEGPRKLQLELVRGAGASEQVLDSAQLTLRVARPEQTHKRTFVSAIDGSVQYFGLVPARPAEGETPGLVLSLHGAAVEGIGQANAYAPKSWAHIVAPTNRRPYGFDWEDWGRLDAIEVLELAREQLGADPRRTYLTGHSMGGHGTWHLGVTFPDRWAAIAPSAGWVSMFSYAGARRTSDAPPITELLQRATNPSDTLSLARNLDRLGVYILHGDKDDNVPVAQARTMRQTLAEFHPDFTYFEQPGAGHWWGNPCCDWPPLFEFLNRHTLPAPGEVRRVAFRTASPGVSARCHWATIAQQRRPLTLSSVMLDHDPASRRFSGTTENVARLRLDVRHLTAGEPIQVELDGRNPGRVAWPADGQALELVWEGDDWRIAAAPSPGEKGPQRYGPFREAFRNRVQFVYATRGTPEENSTSFAKARFDAETFAYRGNGSIELIADTAFDPDDEPERNVVLYGHAESNAAWSALLGSSPIQVRRGSVRVGAREVPGDDLACLFLRPRPGGERSSVGVVGGSGVAGQRLTERLPIFLSGVAFPDWIVIGPEMLKQGAEGVRGAGYFGLGWGLDTGDQAWRP